MYTETQATSIKSLLNGSKYDIIKENAGFLLVNRETGEAHDLAQAIYAVFADSEFVRLVRKMRDAQSDYLVHHETPSKWRTNHWRKKQEQLFKAFRACETELDKQLDKVSTMHKQATLDFS